MGEGDVAWAEDDRLGAGCGEMGSVGPVGEAGGRWVEGEGRERVRGSAGEGRRGRGLERDVGDDRALLHQGDLR